MTTEDFYTPRNCFVQPISEFETAAVLLTQAVDAVEHEEYEQARKLVEQADFQELRDYYNQIVDCNDPEIHRYRKVPNQPERTKQKVKQRMPGKTVQRAVFERDGYRCRFCGVRVIDREVAHAFCSIYPWHDMSHGGFAALSLSLDHIVPHARGGDNEMDNLVSTCYPCQFGRVDWTLAEVCLNDPRDREPIVDDWRGLRHFTRKAPAVKKAVKIFTATLQR